MGLFRWRSKKSTNDPRAADRVGQQMTGEDRPPTHVPGFESDAPDADGVPKHYVSDQPGAKESRFGSTGQGGGGG